MVQKFYVQRTQEKSNQEIWPFPVKEKIKSFFLPPPSSIPTFEEVKEDTMSGKVDFLSSLSWTTGLSVYKVTQWCSCLYEIFILGSNTAVCHIISFLLSLFFFYIFLYFFFSPNQRKLNLISQWKIFNENIDLTKNYFVIFFIFCFFFLDLPKLNFENSINKKCLNIRYFQILIIVSDFGPKNVTAEHSVLISTAEM